jgi:ATP-dependent Clp protease ATP-binding subunit ClpC
MFERFTDRARHVVVLAQEEARMLNHNYIGTEHILLGLIHEGEGVAAQALESLGISLEDMRRDVEQIIGLGEAAPTGHIPFTPRAKKVLELSLREALQLGHTYIGTEHILLGLAREGEGVGAQVLQKRGARLDAVRHQVVQLLGSYAGEEQTRVAGSGEPITERVRRRFRGRQRQFEYGPSIEEALGRVADRKERMARIEALAEEEAQALGHDSVRPGHRWLAYVRLELEETAKDVESLTRQLEEDRRLLAEEGRRSKGKKKESE